MELVRTLKHWFTTPRAVRRAFPEDAMNRIREAIVASEATHSGEIRVAFEAALPTSYLLRDAPARERALMMFSKLRVWDTEHNNGVLIYVEMADHQIEIVADRGVAKRVSESEWRAIADGMRDHFRTESFEAGVCDAVRAVGALLTRHFSLAEGGRNPNELPDTPVVL
ncbi:MAG TPA: TPM domain-containing protein [Burkholderiaceae bacterium]|nr:TPM domain-containing protein [Burkholderiaceae bacterium]HQR69411.1 TPM domain-containing protein [Burkholderiaceae bacterium]